MTAEIDAAVERTFALAAAATNYVASNRDAWHLEQLVRHVELLQMARIRALAAEDAKRERAGEG